MTFRIEKKWRWLVAGGAVFVPGIVSGALSLPFTFKSGDPIRAADVNANFAALQNRLDALTSTQRMATPVGTFTVAGLASALPIYQFSMSVDVPVSLGSAGAGKAPANRPFPTSRSCATWTQLGNQKAAATADIAMGNLSIHLTNVVLTQIAVSAAGAHPQETVGLSYQTIEWVWPVVGGDTKTVDYDRVKATSSSSTTLNLKLGHYAPGATQDNAFSAISSFSHVIQTPQVAAGGGSGGAKPQHGAFTVGAPVSASSFDELAVALSVRAGNAVDLQVFDATGTATNEVKLGAVVVTSFSLTADATGLTNSTSFSYGQIQWLAGKTQTSWDITKTPVAERPAPTRT